jgi:hypothetical protein
LDNGAFDVEWTGYTDGDLKRLFGPEIKVSSLDLAPFDGPDSEFYEVEVSGPVIRVNGPDKAKAKRIARGLATVLSLEVS